MTVDHLEAGGASTLDNTRILCGLCNQHRGAEEHTDHETLSLTKRWYERRGYGTADLWWMHTIPGAGGHDRLGTQRIHRYG